MQFFQKGFYEFFKKNLKNIIGETNLMAARGLTIYKFKIPIIYLLSRHCVSVCQSPIISSDHVSTCVFMKKCCKVPKNAM
jgi:hypothetical protein